MIPKLETVKGIVPVKSFAEYRELEGLNFHTLKDFCDNPYRWSEGWFADNRPVGDALRIGTQAHELILQGEDVFAANNALWTPPVNPKTGEPYGVGTKSFKEALAAWEADNAGRRAYSVEERAAFENMAEELERNPAVTGVLRTPKEDGVYSEVAFCGEMVPFLTVKGSIDRYDDEVGIVDLKTTGSLTEKFWKYDIWDRKYVQQLAFYQSALMQIGNLDPDAYIPCYIVAVETGGQFRSALLELDPEVMAAARAMVRQMIGKYLDAKMSMNYAGPYDGTIVIRTVRGRDPKEARRDIAEA